MKRSKFWDDGMNPEERFFWTSFNLSPFVSLFLGFMLLFNYTIMNFLKYFSIAFIISVFCWIALTHGVDYQMRANDGKTRHVKTTVINRSCGDFRRRGVSRVTDVTRCKRDRYKKGRRTRQRVSSIYQSTLPRYRVSSRGISRGVRKATKRRVFSSRY